MFSDEDLKKIFEESWNKLINSYVPYQFWHEDDMRCLLYHLCAQQLGDENLQILHSEYKTKSGRRYDLILSEKQRGGIAVELKYVPLSKSGVHQKNVDSDLEKLRCAINEDGFSYGYFCILDEHRKLLVPDHLKEQTIYIKKFYPLSG